MNFGEAKTYLRALINRKDITDALAGQFLGQAQDRLERWPQVDPLRVAPRPSFMEKLVTFTLDPEEDEGAFALPVDFLELIDLYACDRELERVDLGTLIRTPASEVGEPSQFCQTGHTIRMRPLPSATTDLYLNYYATQAPLASDEDENAWTTSCIDALVYGAAELAADFYEDERLARFADKFRQAVQELQDQTLAESFSGPIRIQPAYSFQDE